MSAIEIPIADPETVAKYEPVIGLEVHVQLKTKTKIFSGSSHEFGNPANTQTDPVVLGLPGALPVLNREVVEQGVRASLAIGCRVNERSVCPRATRSRSSTSRWPSTARSRWIWKTARTRRSA